MRNYIKIKKITVEITQPCLLTDYVGKMSKQMPGHWCFLLGSLLFKGFLAALMTAHDWLVV